MDNTISIRKNATSNCCGAPVYDDSDICSDCGEHCGLITECPKCEGRGRYDVIDDYLVNSRTISPPYKEVECDLCSGEGTVEEDDYDN